MPADLRRTSLVLVCDDLRPFRMARSTIHRMVSVIANLREMISMREVLGLI